MQQNNACVTTAMPSRWAWLLLFFVSGVQAQSERDAMEVDRPAQRVPAPDFILTDTAGQTVQLSGYAGHAILLTFWATWCAPCREEMPAMQRLWKQYKQRGFVILAVNIEKNNHHGIKEFVNKLGLDFPVLLDTRTYVRDLYEVEGLPTSYLIARDGKLSGRIVGNRRWDSESARALIQQFTQ